MEDSEDPEHQPGLSTAHAYPWKNTGVKENYSKKVSHRQIKTVTYTIVHENGEVCPRTYNQPCVHDDDEDQDDPGDVEGNFLSI